MTERESPAREPDWDRLSAAWRGAESASPPDPAQLRARIDAQTARLRLWRFAEIAVTVAALVGSWIVVARRQLPNGWIVAIDTWGVLVVAWVFVWMGRTTRLPPTGDTIDAYRRKARARAIQRRRVAWLALFLLVAQWTVIGIAHLGTSRAAIGFTVLWAGWAISELRAVRRRLRWLAAFDLESD